MRSQVLATLLVAGTSLFAGSAMGAAPSAGSILQEVQPTPSPTLPSGDSALVFESEGNGQAQPGMAFLVKTFRISGNTLFDSATLHALVAEAEGKTLTLDQLDERVDRITRYYRKHDYPLARAIIPAQAIQDGVVTIEVIEARYGEIKLDNSSRVSTPLLDSIVSPQPGAPIRQKELNRALLLLSDTPGVSVSAALAAGATAGTSDLRVSATPGSAMAGNVVVDGHGSPSTGRQRIAGSLELINPLRHGDVLSLAALSSGPNLAYGRLAYEALLTGRGTRLGASYSALHYKLGGSLEPLDAHGTAQVGSIWLRQPLLRSQQVNIYGELKYNRLQLRDRIDAGDIRTDRRLGNWTASLSGDARDAALSGGVTVWSLSGTAGHVHFNDAAAWMIDAAGAHTQGGYSKWNGTLLRLQRMSPKNTLYVSLSGQWADVNLDPSDKMIGGGPHSVRAYDTGAVSGDTGYLGTIEFRHDMGSWLSARWQALAFVDHAQITINKATWATGDNSARLSGVGLGINFEATQWNGKAYFATPIGASPLDEGEFRSAGAWLEASRRFTVKGR